RGRGEEARGERPQRDGLVGGECVTCPGQHDTDRGEHRGPQDPEASSGARRARVGGSHGGLIIALARGPPYGRSARCATTGRSPLPRRVPHTPIASPAHPPYGRYHADGALTSGYSEQYVTVCRAAAGRLEHEHLVVTPSAARRCERTPRPAP